MQASFVVTKRRVYWSRFTDRHEAIIKEYRIKDGLKVRMNPPECDLRYNPRRWFYTSLKYEKPDWYDKEVEDRVRAELRLWLRAKLIVGGKHKIREGVVYAYNADLTLTGKARAGAVDSTVTLYDDSNAVLRGCSKGQFHNHSTGVLRDDTVAGLQDCSIVEVWDNAYVTSSWDHSKVWYVRGRVIDLYDSFYPSNLFMGSKTMTSSCKDGVDGLDLR
jgi:hypothetical protein